jgi:hypothetical protein
MLCVPASIACAQAGDLRDAQRLLGLAERSAVVWQGTLWEVAIAEAQASRSTPNGAVAPPRCVDVARLATSCSGRRSE